MPKTQKSKSTDIHLANAKEVKKMFKSLKVRDIKSSPDIVLKVASACETKVGKGVAAHLKKYHACIVAGDPKASKHKSAFLSQLDEKISKLNLKKESASKKYVAVKKGGALDVKKYFGIGGERSSGFDLFKGGYTDSSVESEFKELIL